MPELNLNRVPPAPPTEQVVEINEGENQSQSQETKPVESGTPLLGQIGEQSNLDVEDVSRQEIQPDLFFEDFNKRFSTQYKTNDEIKSLFEAPKKISVYEGQLKEFEATKKSAEELKKKITELEESQDPLKYFSSPDTYIAEQLRIKYPKSNPVLLQEIATTDVNKMGDLDVLIKDKQLFVPDAPKEGIIRSVVLKKYGIDPTIPPEEWDEVSVGEMKLDAAAARDKINNLKGVIEMPKFLTKEQRQALEAEAIAKKEQAIAPLKETFSKFDKFVYEGFEFDVPDEYKSKLPDMFQSMFIDAGLEPNEENLQTALELRDALLLKQYFPKIKEVIAKEAETKLQAKIDAELHNTQLPNTATLTDQENVNTLPGISGLFSSMNR